MAHQRGHGDITKRRLTNGHGITTSLWSASHIGAEPRPVPFQMPLSQYRAEAKRVSDDVKRRHDPSVRNMHLQKNYPETRKLLQPPRGSLTNYETPRELKGENVSFPPHNMHRTKWDRDGKPAAQTQPRWCKAADQGFQFTHGHRNQLARRNNDANVNYIIAQHDRSGQPFKRGACLSIDSRLCLHIPCRFGQCSPPFSQLLSVFSFSLPRELHLLLLFLVVTPPPPPPLVLILALSCALYLWSVLGSDLLFPQNASHMQLLQLTKMVNAPDPRVPPKPAPPPGPTWGGMDVGWSNHP